MKMSNPFLPEWALEIGPLKASGRGLLPKEFKSQEHLIDSFTVFAGGHTVTVKPKQGKIERDSSVEFCGSPGTLVWFRRMQAHLGTQDNNTGSPDCLWYGIGLTTSGASVGLRLVADGRTVVGID